MKLLVLDGNSIVNRAFYGIKLLTTKQGEYTNAIYGFMTMLKKLMDETSPDGVAIAFDMRAPTFRHKQYAGYKAKRKGMPPELAAQMPILQELLTDMGYKLVMCEGWEADDILGTLSYACEEKGHECMIATGDRDSLQLVSEKTAVRLATTKMGGPSVTLYDMDKILEDYGVKPNQLIDIKAIQGDSSDNIPGVAGIGEKGAGELIRTFGSLQYIYDNLDELDIKPGMKAKLLASKDNAFLSYDLGTIRRDAPIDTDISSYTISSGDKQKVSETMVRLELFKLMETLGYDKSDAAVNEDESGEKLSVSYNEYEDGTAVLARSEDNGEAYFTFEYENGKITKMVFAFDTELIGFCPTDSFLKAFLLNKGIKKHTHDTKLLHRAAMELCGRNAEAVVFDTILAAYLLNPSGSSYDILRLAAEYFVPVPDITADNTDDNTDGHRGENNENESPEADNEGVDATAISASVLKPLCTALMKAIDENSQRELLENIEIPLASVLAEMEHYGFYVDKAAIENYGEELLEQVEKLKKSIWAQIGEEININSPKQLGKALFETLQLPHGKKTKTGWSTNADVLEELRYMHPVVDEILQYRTLAKLKSTYCDGLVKAIAPDGRIHSSFNQTETRTGRISSTEPNLQNIPVRTEIGKEFRKFFLAEKGVLVDADYSQIELRVLAHVANDSAMLEDFKEGRDIHTATAARVFGMPLDMVTSSMRSKAKAVNFGIVYGIGAFSLSKDIGVSVKEADEYIKEYLKNYSGVDQYMKTTVETAREKGYVETIFGRRRYLPELTSKNFNLRSFGERVARNMPIQGAAADIIKIAMIRVRDRLKAEKMQARLILQVHDELIVEAPNDEAQKAAAVLKEEMENAVLLSAPMLADAGSGVTWYDAKS